MVEPQCGRHTLFRHDFIPAVFERFHPQSSGRGINASGLRTRRHNKVYIVITRGQKVPCKYLIADITKSHVAVRLRKCRKCFTHMVYVTLHVRCETSPQYPNTLLYYVNTTYLNTASTSQYPQQRTSLATYYVFISHRRRCTRCVSIRPPKHPCHRSTRPRFSLNGFLSLGMPGKSDWSFFASRSPTTHNDARTISVPSAICIRFLSPVKKCVQEVLVLAMDLKT